MELVGFLVVALWALPMLLSMGTDNDHLSTLSGTIYSNAAVAGEIFALSVLPRLPPSPWWLVLFIPILLGSYYVIWFVFSESFNRLVRDVLRIR